MANQFEVGSGLCNLLCKGLVSRIRASSLIVVTENFSSACFTVLLAHIGSIIMAIKVLIPTPLQKFTKDQATIECSGDTIDALLGELESQFPGIKARLCDDEGNLRRFINFYVNSEDIRFLEGQKTALKEGDEVSIVPAVAGG